MKAGVVWRKLEPELKFFLTYPRDVLSVKSLAASYIPLPPSTEHNEEAYAVFNVRKTEDRSEAGAPAAKYLDFTQQARFVVLPGLRKQHRFKESVREKSKQDALEVTTSAQLKDLSLVWGPPNFWSIGRRVGLRGLYRGVLWAYVTDWATLRLIKVIEDIARSRGVAIVHQSDISSCESVSSDCTEDLGVIPEGFTWKLFATRIQRWSKSQQFKNLCVTRFANVAAGTITYPLRTAWIRQVCYEPYDQIFVGLIDMARMTVIFDGSGSFYNGYNIWLTSEVLKTLGICFGHCIVEGCGINHLEIGLATKEHLPKLVDTLLLPLAKRWRLRQLESNIPGLYNATTGSVSPTVPPLSQGIAQQLAFEALAVVADAIVGPSSTKMAFS